MHQQQLIAKKRSPTSNIDADSIISYKKRNLNHRFLRLKQIKEKQTDHVAEIYFLQTGGTMMEYPVWRKKANQTADFINLLKQYRLEIPSITEQTTTSIIATTIAAAVTTTASLATATPTVQSAVQQTQSQTKVQVFFQPFLVLN